MGKFKRGDKVLVEAEYCAAVSRGTCVVAQSANGAHAYDEPAGHTPATMFTPAVCVHPHPGVSVADAHTWVLTCANDHQVITFNGPHEDAECPLCAALGRS